VPVGLAQLARLVVRSQAVQDRPAVGLGVLAFLLVALVGLAALVLLAPRAGRRFGAAQRRLAWWLLGEAIPPPPRRGTGARAGLRDGPGWRAAGYLLLKVPLGLLGGYPVFCWTVGLANLTYPLWWSMFRNHPPQVRLDPVRVLTPFGAFHAGTLPGAFAAAAAGAGMVLAAPWLARGVIALDRALMRALLGPGRLAQRVRDLEETRARAVDDTAALLRRVERDLHDGAQMRLAALAMNLGRVREHLDGDASAADLARARHLLDAAHQGAKDALVELRDLARGLHPPVLDTGLADALGTLAAGSPIPVRLATDIGVRPTPAIETIAYFCAAELLANAAKHSHANLVEIDAAQRDGVLVLRVADDGIGGADRTRGSGLAGLAQRAGTVDGRLDIVSPPGGPTRITVELPLRA
jgi:signal transduction histidine kinase